MFSESDLEFLGIKSVGVKTEMDTERKSRLP